MCMSTRTTKTEGYFVQVILAWFLYCTYTALTSTASPCMYALIITTCNCHILLRTNLIICPDIPGSSGYSGQWSGWGVWSTCSTSCGTGYRQRTRTCLTPSCQGRPLATESCNRGNCPIGEYLYSDENFSVISDLIMSLFLEPYTNGVQFF